MPDLVLLASFPFRLRNRPERLTRKDHRREPSSRSPTPAVREQPLQFAEALSGSVLLAPAPATTVSLLHSSSSFSNDLFSIAPSVARPSTPPDALPSRTSPPHFDTSHTRTARPRARVPRPASFGTFPSRTGSRDTGRGACASSSRTISIATTRPERLLAVPANPFPPCTPSTGIATTLADGPSAIPTDALGHLSPPTRGKQSRPHLDLPTSVSNHDFRNFPIRARPVRRLPVQQAPERRCQGRRRSGKALPVDDELDALDHPERPLRKTENSLHAPIVLPCAIRELRLRNLGTVRRAFRIAARARELLGLLLLGTSRPRHAAPGTFERGVHRHRFLHPANRLC